MPDLQIKINVPSGKVAEYVDDYVYVHENTETIDDPEWVDPEDGSEPDQIAKYTNGQWVKEHIRRYITSQIKRGKNAKSRDSLVPTDVDDDIT